MGFANILFDHGASVFADEAVCPALKRFPKKSSTRLRPVRSRLICGPLVYKHIDRNAIIRISAIIQVIPVTGIVNIHVVIVVPVV